MWAAIASVRIGERRLVEIAKKYGVGTFKAAMTHFMDYGEQVSPAGARRSCPRARFELAEEQDDGAHLNGDDRRSPTTAFIVDLRDNPDQVAGPAQHQPRRRDDLRADDLQGADRRRMRRPTTARSGRSRLLTRHGSVFDAKEPAAHGFYYEVEVRVYDLMLALPRAAHAGPAAGRPFRLDLRHVHRRHRIRTPGGTTPSSSRRSAAGAPRAAATAIRRIFSRLPRRDLQLPGRGRRGAQRPLCRPRELNPEDGGEGQLARRQGHPRRLSRPRRRNAC